MIGGKSDAQPCVPADRAHEAKSPYPWLLAAWPMNTALAVMTITNATPADLDEAVDCIVSAFAQDPITGFLLNTGAGYPERVTQFFSLLMRVRLALKMPVLVVRGPSGIHGVAMGYATVRPDWPAELSKEWAAFEQAVPGIAQRMAAYDAIAEKGKPAEPHYYLGVIGIAPSLHGKGLGRQLLDSFCNVSAGDPLSKGVYLETANPSNVRFYERAGFLVTERGNLGTATLWCMYVLHASR